MPPSVTVDGFIDFETQSIYNLQVTATDGTLSNTADVLITLNDLIETNALHVLELLTGPGGPFEGETDPTIIGFDADPDGDGVVNVLELLAGLDPANANGLFNYEVVPTGTDPNIVTALNVTVDSAVDDLLVVNGTFDFELVGFPRTGTRSVISDDGTTRELRYLDTTNSDDVAFGRLEIDPEAIAP